MASGDPSSNHPPAGAAAPTAKRKSPTPGQVLVVTSVMFTFISYWRTAAIVLCDLASTAYYIGGIVEPQIGKAAPWFILAVMLFSYAVRSVYIESCSMFVRGGVYRVVKEAMGGGLAKLSVSALMFDYILTGPISGVSAGQYIIGLAGDLIGKSFTTEQMELGSAAIAIAITLYFWRVNIRGIHESSDKALKIMGATTVMARHHDHLVRGDPDRAAREGEAADDGPRPVAGRSAGLAEARCRGQADPRRAGQAARPARLHRPDPTGRCAAAGTHPLAQPDRRPGDLRRLRPLDPGDERRGDAGAGLSRGREPEADELQEGGVRRLRLQPAPDLADQLLRGDDHPRRRAHGEVQRQPDRRPGDERRRPVLGQAGAQRAGRRRRVPDPLRRGQHGDRRLQRRAEPRVRGRRDARLVPQAAPEVRHDLPAAEPGRGPAALHDRGQPGQGADAGRGLRLRRRLELRLQGAGDAGAPVQGAGPTRVRGPAQRPGRPL